MAWRPATHSDQTDLVAVPFDSEHAPLDFVLNERDQLFAAAARRCTRSYGAPIIWIEGAPDDAP